MTEELNDYFRAVGSREAVGRALAEAKDAYEQAETVAKEAHYRATIAVADPYCGAAVGEDCRHGEGFSYHPYVTHGIRQDLAGVNGPTGKARIEKMIANGTLR